jgi:putative transposase
VGGQIPGRPGHLPSLNGLHNAIFLKNCPRSFARQLGLKPVTTSNGMAESFVKTFKRDYAKLANRADSQTVMSQLKACLDDYNSYYPQSVLGYLPP